MKYKERDIIKVQVTGIEKYGIFVITEKGYNGLIHISEISSLFVKNINDYVKEDEIILAKILEVDESTKQLKLTIKDLDYRINRKNRTKIVETEKGFSTLKNNLDKWIEYKINEINKENINN